MSNETIITNLEVLLAAVEAYPENNLNLSSYKCDDSVCGTLYCVAGLAATLPHFNAQGMYFEDDGEIHMDDEGGDGHVGRDSCTDPLFGPEAWYNLFATYGGGNRDEELGAFTDSSRFERAMTDKQLAVARLKAQIEAVKGEAQ